MTVNGHWIDEDVLINERKSKREEEHYFVIVLLLIARVQSALSREEEEIPANPWNITWTVVDITGGGKKKRGRRN